MNKRIVTSFSVSAGGLLLMSAPAYASGGGGEFHGLYFAGVVVNFVIFVGLLYRFAVPAMSKHYDKQRDDLLAHLESAKKLREQAEKNLTEYQGRLDGLEEERQEILKRYHAQGEAERDRLIAQAKIQIEKMHETAQLVIEQEQRRAIHECEREAVDLAVRRAEVKLRSDVTAQHEEKFVDQLAAALLAEAA